MGLIKLALIGGVAYWAGKKFNERHDGMNQHGYSGPCSRRRRNRHEQQDQVYGARDMGPYQYQDYPEKSTQRYEAEYRNMDGSVPQYGGYDHSRAQVSRNRDEKQMVRYDDGAEWMTPPAYASNARLSPQQRMYPGSMESSEPKRGHAVEQPTWK